ncbi:unnamed protein product [Rhizophagus irregularis]|nr:unnamed protein product [Rhizophagus irregularis]
MLQNNIDCQVSVSTFALYRITGALNWISSNFSLWIKTSFIYFVGYHLRFLDIGYFFGTLDDIGELSSRNF